MNSPPNYREPDSFGVLLQRHRRKAGLTQEALADRARLSPRAISDLERGVRRYPRRETLRLLSDAMGLPKDERTALELAAVRPARPGSRASQIQAGNASSPAAGPRVNALVGRRRELSVLTERLERAVQGEGGVFLIGGEPGIGKSRLLAEFMGHARGRGWLVVAGRAYDTDAMPPYLPFAEALRGHLPTRVNEPALESLLADAPEIVSLLPELRENLGAVTRKPSLGPEADRYRLFEAVRRILEQLAKAENAAGLVFCLDDLQWADASTLLLLEHVARGLAAVPFLLVVTYRDFELNLSPTLADTLERLLRERLSESLTLGRLSLGEVELMLTELAGMSPPHALAERIFAETEGNPLFVEEVFRYLLQKGQLLDESGDWLQDLPAWGENVPQGVSLVIGRRLRQASQECHGLLSIAAVIGRTFQHEILKTVSGLEEEAFFDALEEAQRMHMLSPADGGSLSFTHDLFRQTLLSELSLPRCQRLHERVAQAMEGTPIQDREAQLAELAAHYRLANSQEALRRAVDYAVKAAAHAARVFAYREAADLYDQALESLDLLAPAGKEERCDLLLALGSVLLPAGESLRVVNDIAPLSLKLAEGLADDARARQACALAIEALRRQGMRVITLTDEWQQWARKYDLYAGEDTADRVRLDIDVAEHLHIIGRESEASRKRLDALARARRIGTPDEILRAASFCMYYTQAPRKQGERLKLAEEYEHWPVEGASAETLAYLYLYEGWTFRDWGRRAAAESAWAKLRALPRTSPDNFASFFSFFVDGCTAALEGRLEEVVTLALEAVTTGDRLGSSIVGYMSAALIGFRPLLHLGRASQAAQVMEQSWRSVGVEVEPAYFAPRRLLALAHEGRVDEARILLRKIMADRGIGPSDDGGVAISDLLPLLEASVLLREQSAADILATRLEGVSGLIESHVGTNTSVGRHLGGAAEIHGNNAEARDYYAAALTACDRMGFRPEAALVHLELSGLLWDSSPRGRREASEHLDFAIAELTDMKMEPALKTALTRRYLQRAQEAART